MFNNRSFNVLVGLVIAVLAVLSIGTAINNQQAASVAYTIPSAGENAAMSVPNVTAGRSITSAYAVLKDRQLSQRDPAPANRVPSSAYVTMKDRMLNQLDAAQPKLPA